MIPERTHTFTVRQPNCLIAASRLAPHTSTPSGVIVTGCKSPSRWMDAISCARSP